MSECLDGFKKCPRCRDCKPLTTEFWYTSKARGWQLWCKACQKQYDKERYENNRDEIMTRNRKWREENPDKQRQSVSNYDATHKQERRDWYKEYHKQHKHEINKKHRIYYSKNKQQIQAARRRLYYSNPNIKLTIRLGDQKRRAREKLLPNAFTKDDWTRALVYFDFKCAICGRSEDFWSCIAVGHWIPIADPRPNNPGTVPTNIIPLCHAKKGVPSGEPCCNNSQWKKDPVDWLNERYDDKKATQIIKRIETYFEWVRNQPR